MKICALVAFSGISLGGCGVSMPSCSDTAVEDLALQVFDQVKGFEAGYQMGLEKGLKGEKFDPEKDLSYELTTIRTIGSKDDIGLVSCAGTVNVLDRGEVFRTYEITYTAQPTDDKKSIYVEVRVK